MFEELPGHWTPLIPAGALGETPRGVVVAGEKLALYRGKDGVAALVDACPHRGVALSLGKVREGCLECPFHGWRFDKDGGCRSIPLNPGITRERAATPVPVREVVGLIWVFTGLDAKGTEPVVPEALLRPGVRLSFVQEEWGTHWTRAMENMLDSPHLPFVHTSTIGSSMARRMKPDSKATQDLEMTERGFSLRFSMDGEPPGRLDWIRPNGMELHLLDKPWGFARMHAWCIPTSPGRTSMLIAAAQDFGLLNPLLFLGDSFNTRILTEDRAVVESSGPAPVPPPSEELHVPTDKPTLAFRRWYFDTLALEKRASN